MSWVGRMGWRVDPQPQFHARAPSGSPHVGAVGQRVLPSSRCPACLTNLFVLGAVCPQPRVTFEMPQPNEKALTCYRLGL